MDIAGIVGLLTFWLSLVALCILLVIRTKRVIAPAIVATLVAAVLVQMISFAQIGYLEPFYQVAFFVSLLMGLPIAFVVAFLTRRYLRRRGQS